MDAATLQPAAGAHGGGGPGSGPGSAPVGCRAFLEKFLPSPRVCCENGVYSMYRTEESMGKVRSFYGNFTVIVKALAYILTLGKNSIKEASGCSVYMQKKQDNS